MKPVTLALIFLGCLVLLGTSYAQQANDLQFALQMKGQCDLASGICRVKGNSQVVTTAISPKTDVVTFDVQSLIGAYASLSFQLPTRTNPGKGNMSFGTHLAHNHSISFTALGQMTEIPATTVGSFLVSGAYLVVDGTGVFEHAYGLVSCTTEYDMMGNCETFTYGKVGLNGPNSQVAGTQP